MLPLVVTDVRIKSSMGWHLATLEISETEVKTLKRTSKYFPIEDMVSREYPYSISLKQAKEMHVNLTKSKEV